MDALNEITKLMVQAHATSDRNQRRGIILKTAEYGIDSIAMCELLDDVSGMSEVHARRVIIDRVKGFTDNME